VQPNENEEGLTNDELQDILVKIEAERREMTHSNADEAAI
jgi:hypothetical protein